MQITVFVGWTEPLCKKNAPPFSGPHLSEAFLGSTAFTIAAGFRWIWSKLDHPGLALVEALPHSQMKCFYRGLC